MAVDPLRLLGSLLPGATPEPKASDSRANEVVVSAPEPAPLAPPPSKLTSAPPAARPEPPPPAPRSPVLRPEPELRDLQAEYEDLWRRAKPLVDDELDRLIARTTALAKRARGVTKTMAGELAADFARLRERDGEDLHVVRLAGGGHLVTATVAGVPSRAPHALHRSIRAAAEPAPGFGALVGAECFPLVANETRTLFRRHSVDELEQQARERAAPTREVEALFDALAISPAEVTFADLANLDGVLTAWTASLREDTVDPHMAAYAAKKTLALLAASRRNEPEPTGDEPAQRPLSPHELGPDERLVLNRVVFALRDITGFEPRALRLLARLAR